MKFFIDECLSPLLARQLAEAGHWAIHPRDFGRNGELDHVVLARCLKEDLAIVTENAVDFRKLVQTAELHPGLIILPSVDRESSWRLLARAIEFLEQRGDPEKLMVNHVLEVDDRATCTIYPLPLTK